MIQESTSAPAWTGVDQNGSKYSSESLNGAWYLLYFYPKDDTPGCTKEACGFRDAFVRLKSRLTILGVSADTAESHKKFIEKYDLPFSLLVDTDRSLHTTFGIGNEYPKRTTFLIDPQGVVRKIYREIDCEKHAEEIEQSLDALRVG